MARITGGCLCGAVKYYTDAEPVRTVVCHCTICQRHIGSAFATLMAFPAGSIAVSGTLKTYTETRRNERRALSPALLCRLRNSDHL
jgi:hypothetical protein